MTEAHRKAEAALEPFAAAAEVQRIDTPDGDLSLAFRAEEGAPARVTLDWSHFRRAAEALAALREEGEQGRAEGIHAVAELIAATRAMVEAEDKLLADLRQAGELPDLTEQPWPIMDRIRQALKAMLAPGRRDDLLSDLAKLAHRLEGNGGALSEEEGQRAATDIRHACIALQYPALSPKEQGRVPEGALQRMERLAEKVRMSGCFPPVTEAETRQFLDDVAALSASPAPPIPEAEGDRATIEQIGLDSIAKHKRDREREQAPPASLNAKGE